MYRHFLIITLFILIVPQALNAAEYQQVSGLIDTRTTHSDGAHSVEELALLAQERGFEVLFFNDHDRLVMEYGLFPFRNIIKRRVELNSINKQGADRLLGAIQNARMKFPKMILIPGSESVPFYYWKGSFFTRNLTAHDHEKRILTIGMEESEDYEDLPMLHNGYSTRFSKHYLPAMIPFIISLIMGLILLKERRILRISGIIVSAISILLLINTHPFRSSPFDQYHDEQGIAPYQLFINHVSAQGGLTFWNYPETASGVRKLGPIYLNTPPYPDALVQAVNYTGFAAIYGDNITVTEPGRQWDQILLAYCKGERKQPVWGIATADFHRDGEAGQKLGDFPTVFLVRKKTKQEVLSAMRNGRMYAGRSRYPQQIILKDFSICSSDCSKRATLGEEIRLNSYPHIRISLEHKNPVNNKAQVRLIRSGKLIKTFSGSLPMDIDFEDKYYQPGEKIFYRIDVKSHGAVVSNPIFVTFG